MFFTQEDYLKIEKWLKARAVKDSQFPELTDYDQPNPDDYFVILQGNKTNAKVKVTKAFLHIYNGLQNRPILRGSGNYSLITDSKWATRPNEASGEGSIAIGLGNNKASQYLSIAIGQNNIVDSQFSWGLGSDNNIQSVDGYNKVFGNNNIINRGSRNCIIGDNNNLQYSSYNYVFGLNNHISNSNSSAIIIGSNNSGSDGGSSTYIGKGLEGTANDGIASVNLGQYNINVPGNNYLFTIGNGKDGNRSNIFSIGYNGDINIQNIGSKTLQAYLKDLETSKQNKLIAGAGIEISSNNTISCTLDPVIFVVVDTLPLVPEDTNINKIHLVKDTTVSGNLYSEYLYVNNTWEKLGDFQPSIDLSEYAKTADIPVEKGTMTNSIVQKGSSNDASGNNSSAFGWKTRATGNMSHTEGFLTLAQNSCEHAEGYANISIQGKTIHTVGIGDSSTNRKNAHEIHLDGKHYIYGIGGYDGTNSQTEGIKTVQEVVEETNTKINSLTEKTTSLDSRTPVDSGISFMHPWELFPDYSEDVQDVQNYILPGFLLINNQMTNIDGLFNHIRDNNLAGKAAYFTIYSSSGNPSAVIIGNIDNGAVGYKISFSTISRYSDNTSFNNRLIFFEIEIGNPTGDGITIMNSRLMNIPIKDTLSQIDNNTSKIQTLETKNAELTNTITELEPRVTNAVQITYAELKSLRDAGTLVPGQQYRITDYNCTTTQAGTKSAGHAFDIIVTADDESTLNEEARAALHTGDEYFSGCNLSAWKIWYCLDNDTNRFAWADATNGKGVIYRMIDEFNNDCPYDFKNIQFYRKWYATKSLWSIISSDNTGVPCYTFSSSGNSATTLFTDMSLLASNSIYSNVIGKYVNSNKQTLNNICFFGNNCYFNSFGNDCSRNTFGNDFSRNTFGINCYSNTFGNKCSSNTFGNCFQGNTFGISCWYNIFGINCYNNTFGNDCYRNTFGNNCGNNTFGNNCGSNTFGNSCIYIKFASDSTVSTKYSYYQNNHFGDGCQYIVFTGIETASSSAQVQNYNFAQGLKGTSSVYLTIDGKRNLAYETKVAKNSNGEIKIYCEADLIL